MKKVTLKVFKRNMKKVPGFPYQLTEWMKSPKPLACFIADFARYKDEDYGRIVHGLRGYAIFTRGKRLLTLLQAKRPGPRREQP